MSFERIAGPRKGKATANRSSMETSGSVRGSNPGKAGKMISPVKETFKNKAPKKRDKVIDNETRGSKKFFNPDASN
jgi:hypothetical protein